MSPNTTAASALPHVPRTVAMRKEANELRKTLKPLLEKRRRARINESLNRLKTLILPLTGKDSCRYSKLEKADVLEMTVRFLTDIQSTPSKDSTVSFKEGYKTCLQRVSALLPNSSLDTDTCERVHEFIQRSMISTAPACQTCCTHSSKMISQLQQKLMNLKSSSCKSLTAPKSSNAMLSLSAPAPLTTTVWRPW